MSDVSSPNQSEHFSNEMIEDSFQEEKNVLRIFSSFVGTKVDELERPNNINCVFESRNLLMHLLVTPDVDELELDKKIHFLINSGLSMKHEDNQGCNILFYLIECYRGENLHDNIKLCIEKGVEINCKNKGGRNVLQKLVQSKLDCTRKAEVMRMLICYGIEVSTEINTDPEFYEEYFKSTPKSGSKIIQFMVEHKLTMGWHLNCQNCKDLLSITGPRLKALFHYYAFRNIKEVVYNILEDLKKWSKTTCNPLPEDQDQQKVTDWLLCKAEELTADPHLHELGEGFKMIAELYILKRQIENFNCERYEEYLRRARRMAELLGMTKRIAHLDWSFLTSFDFSPSPVHHYSLFSGNGAEAVKTEMDKVLVNWFHPIDSDYDGEMFLELAEIQGDYGPKHYKYKCHGQE